MKYAILGDIHSNLGALQAVLADASAQAVDQLVSVGDVVGYGAAPREAIAMLRERGAVVVKGNHDAACTGELDTTFFNPYARAAVEWTVAQLTPDDLAWLSSLPMRIDLDHCSVAHGTYADPERFDYVQSIEDAESSLESMPRQLCFVGHTHVPVTVLRMHEDPTKTFYTLDTRLDLQEVHRALVNVGSVGQPRDEDPRTGWALFDSEEQLVEIRRIDYDIERESRRIVDAGLPAILGDRLHQGF